jgi:hypothetical protein
MTHLLPDLRHRPLELPDRLRMRPAAAFPPTQITKHRHHRQKIPTHRAGCCNIGTSSQSPTPPSRAHATWAARQRHAHAVMRAASSSRCVLESSPAARARWATATRHQPRKDLSFAPISRFSPVAATMRRDSRRSSSSFY